MRNFVYKHTLGYVLLFVFTLTFAQKKHSSKASSSQLNLEGKALTGYTTSFDFAREDVRKGWWKFAREFGSPLNMKTYYKVTIPSERTDGNVDLEIFTQTTDGQGGTEFFLGLENKTYKDQALTMILDFKKKFYINDLLEQIETNQAKSEKLSSEYRDAVLESKQQELLKQITDLEKENQRLKEKIKKIEKG
ncbi:hypothetical protein [Ekhidna sp. To15]|uniref:hypothetical protein n=1 Tax=Ekhidna sp. To15 TaxID=3395267 RepID=UPI003F51E486